MLLSKPAVRYQRHRKPVVNGPGWINVAISRDPVKDCRGSDVTLAIVGR